MADAEISDYAAEAETLAERVDWARGGELTAALEELEAVSAAAPAEAGPHATSALVRLLAKNDCGPEAAQRAVETLSRLADSTKHGQAATKNGALFLSDPKNVVVILDVLEEEQQETYTIVVALELVASLHRDHAERLRRALLDTPAGAARLLDRISDHRDAVRNAAVQLWERLTRPESVESRSSDDLRLNCAFADVFAKCYACLEDEGDSAAARACVHLVANVLNGPPTIVALFDDHGLAWLVSLLEVPPLDVAATGDEEVIGSPSMPRKQVDTEACRDARRLASAALAVLRRYLKRCDDDSRRRAWAFEDLRLSVLTLALTDDEGRVVDLDAPQLYPAGLVKDPSSELWWSTLTDESAKAPSRDDVRAAALEVVLLNVRDDPQLCLSFCESKAPTDGLSPPAFGVALGMAFKPRTFGPASISASSLAETIWADESSAIAAVMFAVAPPPDAEGESAVSLLLADLDNQAALSLLRSLLARSDAVRDLALRLEGGQLFSKLLTKALVNEDALALICRWLDGCSQACRAMVRDPELLSKLCELDGRLKGLSCLALGLCATHFGEEAGGWSARKVADFVASTVGYGPFAYLYQRCSFVREPVTRDTNEFLRRKSILWTHT
jgi:hypothetical protein